MADLTITAANVVLTSGAKGAGIAGAAITAGQVLYLDGSAGTLKLAQADGTSAEADAVGIALHAASTNQPVQYAADGAALNIGATTSKATTYCVGAAAGGIAPQADLSSGQRIVQVGYATATDGSFVVDLKNRGVTV